jgi:outer membrane lipoprotein-sorting protein
MQLRSVRAATAAVLLVASVASADTLKGLLETVTEAAQLAGPLRADAKLDVDGIAGKKQDRLVLFARPAGDAKNTAEVYVELEQSKVRLLALSPRELLLAADGKVRKVNSDAALDGTGFTAEDFLPFSTSRCAAMRIAELGDEQWRLVCEPQRPPSQYTLIVYKFDREKSVLLQALLYKETQSNLVKAIKQDDFVQVGSKWLPKTIIMQDFKLRTRDTLSLEWKADAKVPAEAFDSKGFAGVSAAK